MEKGVDPQEWSTVSPAEKLPRDVIMVKDSDSTSVNQEGRL